MQELVLAQADGIFCSRSNTAGDWCKLWAWPWHWRLPSQAEHQRAGLCRVWTKGAQEHGPPEPCGSVQGDQNAHNDRAVCIRPLVHHLPLYYTSDFWPWQRQTPSIAQAWEQVGRKSPASSAPAGFDPQQFTPHSVWRQFLTRTRGWYLVWKRGPRHRGMKMRLVLHKLLLRGNTVTPAQWSMWLADFCGCHAPDATGTRGWHWRGHPGPPLHTGRRHAESAAEFGRPESLQLPQVPSSKSRRGGDSQALRWALGPCDGNSPLAPIYPPAISITLCFCW